MGWFSAKTKEVHIDDLIKPPVYKFDKADFSLQERAQLRRQERDRIRREAAQQAARLEAGDIS